MIPLLSIPRTERKDTDNDQALVRNEIIKFVYAGMLLQLPLSKVKEFFVKNPPPGLPSPGHESDVFKSLWTDGGWIPLHFLTVLFNRLDVLLAECGITTEEFIQTALEKVNNGPVLPASMVLYMGKPFIKLFFLKTDLRLLLLRTVNHFTAQISPTIVQRIVKHESDGIWNTTTLLFMIAKTGKRSRLPKKQFACPFPKFDCELWTAKIVQTIPQSLKLAPFEERFMLADCRNMNDILSAPDVTSSDSRVFIKGKLYGFLSTFSDFCKKNDLEMERYQIPDKKIVVMLNDYYDETQKRIILHKGCAYGSPVYLYGFRYRKNISIPKDFLSPLLDIAVGAASTSWDRAKTLHDQILDCASQKAVIVYHGKDESISVNGVHFVKNVPAKILRKIIMTYCSTGQTVFSHREFAMDRSIFNDSKHPNFVVRLQRLSQALESQFPFISLSKTSRGRISFVPTCKLEFHDQ